MCARELTILLDSAISLETLLEKGLEEDDGVSCMRSSVMMIFSAESMSSTTEGVRLSADLQHPEQLPGSASLVRMSNNLSLYQMHCVN